MLVPLAVRLDGDLFAAAESIYDDPAFPRAGILDGASWMRRALGSLRGAEPQGQANWLRLWSAKYLAAFAGGLLLTPLGFYVVEVQWVFLFPVALDGSAHPFRDSRRLMQNAGGTRFAMRRVIPIAAQMLLGGFS